MICIVKEKKIAKLTFTIKKKRKKFKTFLYCDIVQGWTRYGEPGSMLHGEGVKTGTN